MNNVLEFLEKTAETNALDTGVDDGRIRISWRELMEASQRIGTAVSKMTEPRRPVAILMEKSTKALSAMFGAVYAGCFYTMVEPTLPAERILEIFRVLSPEVVITDMIGRTALKGVPYTGKIACFKECLQQNADADLINQIRRSSRDIDILYCMFTSGSTGVPKGIVVSHRAVIDFVSHFSEEFQFTEQDRIGNQAPFDFDVSVKDIYTSVFTGASLILIPQRLFSTPPRLLDYLCGKRVNTLIWAVSALTLISSLKGLQYRVPVDIKRVMFSGEVMPAKQLRMWQEALPDAEFINLYGPTETTCNCTYYRIHRVFADNEKIPIGKPFPGRKLFLLDEAGNLISERDKMGEICVAGESLSEGYFCAKEETEKRFCKWIDGQRFYRSGDLGYLGSDGEFYYVGRKDFQVKIMGRRIEPEEVEYVLNQMEGVEKSCCLVNKKRSQLLAYYCGEAEEKDLRRHLRERLPVYMIPQKLIRIERIPVNKNGKTDRTQIEAL